MGIVQYGNTWWGERWLASLTMIDDTNRLPRGRTYARGGKVADIELKNETIHTTVKGSRPRPYKVTLSMGPISKSSVNTMLDKVMEYPSIISKLLNGKLDPQLLELASSVGIKLFPTSSRDMKMKCSCPDYAVPCKHLAASIYKVCADVDNDPFVLFRFRGVDLQKLLKQRKVNIYDIQNRLVPFYSEFVDNHSVKEKKKKNQKLPLIDYSKISDRHSELLALLGARPSFYPQGDFKNEYAKQLRNIAKKASRILSERDDLGNYYNAKSDQFTYDEFDLVYRENTNDIGDFNLAQLLKYEPRELDLTPFSTKYYSLLLNLSLHCIATGLVTPELYQQSDKRYVLRWMPAILDGYIGEVVEKLEILPGVKLASGKRADSYMSLSIFITELIHILQDVDRYDVISSLFFKGVEERFDRLSESAIPNVISRWLKLYSFDLGDYFPVINVEDKQGKFIVDIHIGMTQDLLAAPVTFKSFVKDTKDKSKLLDCYKDLDLLSSYMPNIGRYIDSKGEEGIAYSLSEFPEFLFDIQPILKLLGIKVVLPKALKSLVRPRKSVSLSTSSGGDSSGLLGLADLLNFDWRISLGDEVVTPQAFNKLMTKAGGLIKYKSKYIYIDEADFARLQKELKTSRSLSSLEVLSIALTEELDGATIDLSTEVRSLIKSMTKIDNIPPPAGLNATFRPYQHVGYSWMVKNMKIGVGSIIADDMGLGKTLQVIAFITHLVEEGYINNGNKAIIIVPTSLIPNWEAEFCKFASGISVFTFYGPTREVDQLKEQSVIITSYGTIRSDIVKVKKYKWLVSVIDEAQNIKNPTSQQTKAIKALKADNNIAMSGTPVENRLMDYWSIMDYTNRGLLGNKTNFLKKYDKPISKNHDQDVLARFKKITAPFIMRRMKTDKSIISDLPEKIIQDTFASLTSRQSALYQKVVNEGMDLIRSEEGKEDTSLFKKQGLVLQMILSLKQICNHPTQWLKDGQANVADSGKLQLLVDTMKSIIDAGDKALIFTQFKEMGDIISETLVKEMGIKPLWLHGGITLKNRKQMVDQFQNQDHQRVMILSLKAGGTGLNLTAANHVIHYDLWWNPAVEAQATDRAFRIGQHKNVFVHRFITQHTFEEKINDLINTKKALAEMTVTSGENWIGNMSGRELAEVFRLDQD